MAFKENGISFLLTSPLHSTQASYYCTTRLPGIALFPKGNSTQGPSKHKAQQQRAGMEAVHTSTREARWTSTCIKNDMILARGDTLTPQIKRLYDHVSLPSVQAWGRLFFLRETS